MTRETAGRLTIKAAESVSAGGSRAAVSETVARVEPAPFFEDAGEANWPDESAESAFLSEARERGESIVPAKAREDIAEERDSKVLPPLDELVQRIPPEVRAALDDLFRAKFTTVRRIPRKALKG